MEESSRSPLKDPREIARKYQLELCKKAVEENLIVYLGTGCGKTHIAVLLMYELRHLILKPGRSVFVFLAPTVPLVLQQAVVIENSTNFKVSSYFGKGKHLKDHADWDKEIDQFEVLVMTPQILLHNLQHCFIRMEHIALLIFDECHHAQVQSRHPYAQIMKEFYKTNTTKNPRIFGMTATPIVGKGGLSQLDYSRCINSLESLLDAKICSVDDNFELESVAATPDIKICHYGPVANHPSGSILTCMQKLEEIKDQCICMMREQCDVFQECLKKIKNLQRIHENLIFCLENIGLQGASYATERLLSSDCNDLMQMELDNGDKVGCIADHYLKRAHSVLNFAVFHDDTESDLTSLEALEEPFFSKKLIVLIEMLSTYRLRSNAKCIIFVERVLVARSLAYIIGNLKPLDFWKCEFLVGCHSGLKSMSRKKMNAIVDEFSSGKLNLLVATNVAEEGLDIQTCCVVVRFDWPKTVSSFIQSRGRARMQKSEYVFLLERENERDEELLKSFLTRECIMNQEIISRTSVESFNDLEEKIYKVYSTGASVSTGCSISLLHHYCAKLPRDMYFTPQPKFFFLENLDGTICRVILPPNAALRQVDSYPCSSKDEAKRLASLRACIALHERGALSDYLLPGHGKGMKKANSSECEDTEDDYLREELHEMLVPAALREQWSDSEAHVLLHFYEIKFIPIPEDRPYRKFGLVVNCPLPKEAEAMEVDLHLAHGRIVKTNFISSGIITFSREEITLAEKFQEMFLKVILDRSEFFSDVVHLGSNLKSEVCSLTFYLLLPVKQCAHGNCVVIDWHTIRCCLSSPAFGYQVNSYGMGHASTYDTLELLNGPIKKVDVLGSLIFTKHNKQFFFIDDIADDINGNSQRKGPKDISNAQHYKERFGIQLKHPDQPFLKAKQLFTLRNLLHNRIQESTVVRETEEHFDVLPPELCCLKIIGFSKDIGSSLSLLPSLMHRLQNLLLAVELKYVLSRSVLEASTISGDCILEALTTEKCLERFSLERFEVLGDAFLKYAVGRHSFLSFEGLDEGQLTRKRSSIVNNANLYDLAIKNNLQVYICDESFEPSQFFALGRPCMVPCKIDTKSTACYRRGKDIDADVAEAHKCKCSKAHRWLHRKRIADVVEALIGAFLVESGFRAATAFLRWLGIQVDFEILDVRRVLNESKVNMSLIGKIDVPALEELLGYEFLHKGLLLQAFVHPSYQKHSGGCYQKLEFLGDAVMEYLVTSYLYSVYPDLKPGQLTDLRSITVNNNSLALTAAQQFFHLYLLKDSSSLTQAINEFVSYVQSSESEQEQLEEPSFPKVLGDIVESCIGAILLDSGFNLQLVWTIMLKLLNPILSFSSFKLNPVRELWELCQYKNFELRFPDPEKVSGDYLVRTEIYANGETLSFTATNHSSKVAKRMAAQEALQELKARGYRHKSKSLGEIVQSTHKKEAQLIGYDEECVVIDPNDLLQSENLVLPNSAETPLDLDWQVEQVVPPSGENSHLGQSNLSRWPSGEPSAHTDKLQNNSHDPALPQQQIQQNFEISNDFMENIGKKTARSKLYEICAAQYWNRPEFVCCKEEGPDHLRMFTCMVSVKAAGIKSILLECKSDPKPQKKTAEEHAAQGALWCLNHLGYLNKQ